MRLAFIAIALIALLGAARQAVPINGVPPFSLGPPPAGLTVNATNIGPLQNVNKLGVDATIQIDMTNANTVYWGVLTSVGVHTVRWPDDRTGQWHCYSPPPSSYPTTTCNVDNVAHSNALAAAPDCVGNPNSGCAVCITTYNANSGAAAGFDNFMGTGALASLGSQMATLSANYGTNYACNGPGDPNEAAAWAAYCKLTYGAECVSMTIGTEVYNCIQQQGQIPPPGFLCRDLHGGGCIANSLGQCTHLTTLSGDPTIYGQQFATWQNAIHAAASGVKVCVLGATQKPAGSWDTLVSNALTVTPDCQEIEYYPYNTAGNNDTDQNALYTYTLGFDDSACGVSTCTGPTVASFVGQANTRFSFGTIPIYVDQIALQASTPGTISLSITGAMALGQVLLQAQLDPNIFALTWHTAQGKVCNNPGVNPVQNPNPLGNYLGPNFSFLPTPQPNPALLGPFGDASFASIQDTTHCGSYTANPGQLMAPGYMYQVVATAVNAGEHMLGISPANTTGASVAMYAMTKGTSKDIVLFNRDSSVHNVCVTISNQASGLGGTTLTYGKTQYDASSMASWVAPVAGSFGAWSTCVPLTLPVWSVTVATVTNP